MNNSDENSFGRPAHIPELPGGPQKEPGIRTAIVTILVTIASAVAGFYIANQVTARYFSKPVPLTAEQKVELKELYQQCKLMFAEMDKALSQAAEEQEGAARTIISFMQKTQHATQMGDKNCAQMRRVCKRNFNGSACVQHRQTIASWSQKRTQ